MSIRPDRATLLALAALYEVAGASRAGPIIPTVHLRALLALLHARSNGDVAPYQAFWRQVLSPDQTDTQGGYVRATYARTELCRIIRTLGLEPQALELHDLIAEISAGHRGSAFRASLRADEPGP